jgi:hypothetical protein
MSSDLEPPRASVTRGALLGCQATKHGCLDLVDHVLRGRKSIPQPRRAIGGVGQNALAVGREGDGEDTACLSQDSCAQPNAGISCAMLYRAGTAPTPPTTSDGHECRDLSCQVANQGQSVCHRHTSHRRPSCRPLGSWLRRQVRQTADLDPGPRVPEATRISLRRARL